MPLDHSLKLFWVKYRFRRDLKNLLRLPCMTVWYEPNVIESKPVTSLLASSSWLSYAADIYNSPLEAARYTLDGPDVAPGIVNVVLNMPGEASRAIAEKQ